MWKFILGQAAYQLLVLTVLTYFGVFMFFDEEDRFNIVTDKGRDANMAPTGRLVLDTIIFNTFVLMNLINMINCKVGGTIDSKEKMKIVLSNPMFWIVLGGEFALQYFLIKWGNNPYLSIFVGTAPMTQGMTITCVVLGLLSIPVNIALKHIPSEYFDWAKVIDLEKKQNNVATGLIEKSKSYMK